MWEGAERLWRLTSMACSCRRVIRKHWPEPFSPFCGTKTVMPLCRRRRPKDPAPSLWKAAPERIRSEEHTSELQSLMRISYAVFCLKKKKKQTNSRLQEENNK